MIEHQAIDVVAGRARPDANYCIGDVGHTIQLQVCDAQLALCVLSVKEAGPPHAVPVECGVEDIGLAGLVCIQEAKAKGHISVSAAGGALQACRL